MPAFDERERAAVAEVDSTAELREAADTLLLLEGWLPGLQLKLTTRVRHTPG
jgi:hypothetical protein